MTIKVGRLPPGSPALSTKALNTSNIYIKERIIFHIILNITYHIDDIEGRPTAARQSCTIKKSRGYFIYTS